MNKKIDADLGAAWEKLDNIVQACVSAFPNFVIASILMVLVFAFAFVGGRLVARSLNAAGKESLGSVLGRLVRWVVITFGALIALTIVVPSLKPANVLGGMGIGSVAIGFAFKDILQNLFAGLLILFKEPFKVGDVIQCGGHEGVVEKIETRATFLKTFDGRRVVMPNSDVYTNAIEVNNAHQARRGEYVFSVGYDESIEEAKAIIQNVLQSIDAVLQSPAPDVLVYNLAASSINLKARWWVAQGKSLPIVADEVLQRVKVALDEKSIDIPYPTRLLLHGNEKQNAA